MPVVADGALKSFIKMLLLHCQMLPFKRRRRTTTTTVRLKLGSCFSVSSRTPREVSGQGISVFQGTIETTKNVFST